MQRYRPGADADLDVASSGTVTSPSTPSVPDYETTLDLSDEEKEAAVGALLALDDFVAFSNELFKSGGTKADRAEAVATGDSLEEVEQAAESIRTLKTKFEGEVTVKNREVKSVDLDEADYTVSIQACSPLKSYSFVTPGITPTAKAEISDPVYEFRIVKIGDAWKVAQQSWVGRECAG